MVQSVVNNFNNIQEMLGEKTFQFNDADKYLGIDSTSFDKFLTNNIDKSQKNKKLSHYVNSENVSKDFENFKKSLKKAQSDAVAESSLELTLGRDINEIISQFKDFLESTTEDGKVVIDENMLEKLQASDLDEDLKKIFEQLMVMINTKFSQNQFVLNDLSELKGQLNNILESVSEQMQTAEDISEVMTEKLSKLIEENSSQDNDTTLNVEMLEELNVEVIEADVDSTGGDTLMQKQSAEEQGIKAMLTQDAENFDASLLKVSEAQRTNISNLKHTQMTPSRILEQISRQLESMQTNSKVNIVLNPESLGKVNIQLMSTKSGLVAQFTVTSPETRDLLMKGLDGLKDTLLVSGVNVDNVSIKLNETQESQYDADWTEKEGSRGGNKGNGQPNREEKEKGLFETMFAQTINNENGNV